VERSKIEVGVEYAYSTTQSEVYPGVDRGMMKVKVLEIPAKGLIKTNIGMVQPRHLRFAWVEHVEATRQRKRDAEEAVARGQAADAKIRELLGEENFEGNIFRSEYGSAFLGAVSETDADGSYSTGRYGTFSSVTLAGLLETAYQRGRQDAIAEFAVMP